MSVMPLAVEQVRMAVSAERATFRLLIDMEVAGEAANGCVAVALTSIERGPGEPSLCRNSR